jgi:hypothetical protein
MLVVVLFAVVHAESSNVALASGSESINFQPVSLGTVIDPTAGRGVSVPVNPPAVEVTPAVTRTLAPFHVTVRTADGATIVSGTVTFRSPVNVRVDPEMLALRTRYGPPTNSVLFEPMLQKLGNVEVPGTTGAQNVAAVW